MDAIFLECSHWSQLKTRALERVQRAFATYRDVPTPRKVPREINAELLRRLRGDPAARGIMWFCIASSVGVFVAWNWSLGNLPHQIDTQGRSRARSAQQLSVFEKLSNNFTIKLEDIQKHRWWTLVTPAFSHIGMGHLIGNLFAFQTFSTMAIQGGLPALGYGILVFGSAVSGHLAFLYQDAQRHGEQVRRREGSGTHAKQAIRQSQALGLSGVVMGLGTAVSLVMPRAPVLLFGFIPTPMWALMIGYVIYDSARLDDMSSRTGHAAHLGGAAFGAFYYFLKLRRGGR